MMKKVLSLLLAVFLLASLTLTASTAEEEVFSANVSVYLCGSEELYYGDQVCLRASVSDANMPYTITWQCNSGAGWEDIAGENGETYAFIVTPENAGCEYRVVLSAE